MSQQSKEYDPAPWDDLPEPLPDPKAEPLPEPESEPLFSLDDAAELMCGYKHGQLFRGQWGIEEHDDERFIRVRQELEGSTISNAQKYRFELCGFYWRNDFNVYPVDKAVFPQQAYFCWWLANHEAMTFPKWFREMPHIESYVDKNGTPKVTAAEVLAEYQRNKEEKPEGEHERAETPREDVAKADSAAVTEIAEGVTVADMRALFDPNGPRYRPSLAAAVRLWVSFERAPMPVKTNDAKKEPPTPKQECALRIKDLRAPGDDLTPLWGENENKAILLLVNWSKDGSKFK